MPTFYAHPMPYLEEVRLHQRILDLLARKLEKPELHPIFYMLPELPQQIVDAVYRGADKVRRDNDAESFAVTVKIGGEVMGGDLRTETKVTCEVKCTMYSDTDKSVAPVDSQGRVIPPTDRVKATPLGKYMDAGDEPDCVIYPRKAA